MDQVRNEEVQRRAGIERELVSRSDQRLLTIEMVWALSRSLHSHPSVTQGHLYTIHPTQTRSTFKKNELRLVRGELFFTSYANDPILVN